MGAFPVHEVKIVGLKQLAPEAVIAAMRLSPAATLFDDTRLLEDRVRGLNGVADAAVRRRLPGTLEVRVREVEPAALAPERRGGPLVAVDAKGHPLPFAPDRAGLDLPIVATRDSSVIGVLALVQSVDPALFETITGAKATTRGDVVLECGSYHVLVRRDANPDDIRSVTAVVQDLAVRGRPFSELDARFDGQVVVRGRGTPVIGGRGL